MKRIQVEEFIKTVNRDKFNAKRIDDNYLELSLYTDDEITCSACHKKLCDWSNEVDDNGNVIVYYREGEILCDDCALDKEIDLFEQNRPEDAELCDRLFSQAEVVSSKLVLNSFTKDAIRYFRDINTICGICDKHIDEWAVYGDDGNAIIYSYEGMVICIECAADIDGEYFAMLAVENYLNSLPNDQPACVE